jgi:hypothetical protein
MAGAATAAPAPATAALSNVLRCNAMIPGSRQNLRRAYDSSTGRHCGAPGKRALPLPDS